jgi:hypothetical protein
MVILHGVVAAIILSLALWGTYKGIKAYSEPVTFPAGRNSLWFELNTRIGRFCVAYSPWVAATLILIWASSFIK